jgi:membrane-associated phospholipid phosphatase
MLGDPNLTASRSNLASKQVGMGSPHTYAAAGCAVVFVIMLAASVTGTRGVEIGFVKWLNAFAARSTLLDFAVYGLTYNIFSGAVLLAFVWYCWFAAGSQADRSRILVSLVATFVAGALSRVLQLVLPTHPRPLHDPALAFTPPLKVDPTLLSHWNSFPSDHAAVYFGLGLVVYLARPRLGFLIFGVVVVLDLARIYLGLHFPTDVIGGGAFGLLVVIALYRNPVLLSLSNRLLRYERGAPAFFYSGAFFVSYGMANLFDEVRSVLKGLLLVIGAHPAG